MPPTGNTCSEWRRVKLLFDQNLSPSLPKRLREQFPGSVHVRDIHMDRAPDHLLWEFARDNGYTIVTQDADFTDRALLHGFPPKIVWLRCGNPTARHIEALLRDHADLITDMELDNEAGVLAVR